MNIYYNNLIKLKQQIFELIVASESMVIYWIVVLKPVMNY